MNIKEKLHALLVLDELLCETDEDFDKNESQLPTDDTQTSGKAIS